MMRRMGVRNRVLGAITAVVIFASCSESPTTPTPTPTPSPSPSPSPAPVTPVVPALPSQIDSVSPSQTITDSMEQPVALLGLHFDSSMTVHILEPDGAQIEKGAADFEIETGSVLRFPLVFSKVGTYTFSLWIGSTPASNSGEVRVR